MLLGIAAGVELHVKDEMTHPFYYSPTKPNLGRLEGFGTGVHPWAGVGFACSAAGLLAMDQGPPGATTASGQAVMITDGTDMLRNTLRG